MTASPALLPTIAVLGATGRTGRRVIEYALAAGHPVRALARRPEALADLAHPHLTVVAGDAADAAAVTAVVGEAPAVISTLGGGTTAAPGTTRSTAMRLVAEALTAAGRPDGRVLAVAGGGILDAPGGGLRQEQPQFPAVFRAVSAEHRRTWEVLQGTTLAWTLACTGDIVPGARTGEYRVLPDVLPEGGRRISVEDLADFLLREMHEGRWPRRRVGVGY